MILPVRETVLFPGVILPITVGRRSSIEVAQRAVKEQRQLGILMQRSAEVADPTAIDMHTTGVICNVMRYITTPDGSHHLVCQGEHRFRVREFLSGWPFMVARVTRIEEQDVRTPGYRGALSQFAAHGGRGPGAPAANAFRTDRRRAIGRDARRARRSRLRLSRHEAGREAGSSGNHRHRRADRPGHTAARGTNRSAADFGGDRPADKGRV